MKYFLVIFLPFIVFLNAKKPLSAFISFFLQISVFGWIPASLWALTAINYNEFNKKEKIDNHARV